MNDKTLLELAVKAGGYLVERWNDGTEPYSSGEGFLIWTGRNPSSLHFWNPLSSDGDALHLAVKLRIDFYIGDDSGEAAYAGYYKSSDGDLRQRFMIQRFADSPSPYAATRRAIVRAAAAIAEQGEKE